MMDPREAAIAVLREEAAALHWTRIQDLALRRGYIDPFAQSNVRKQLLAALADLVREGEVRKRGTGVYELAG